MLTLPFPVRDANASSGGKDLGNLPEWNLSDLYSGEDAPELKRDLDWFETEATAFADDYQGKVTTLSAADLLTSIQRSEKMDNIAGRIMSYAGLRYYQLTTDATRAKFLSDMQERIINASSSLVFYWLEFNQIADDAYDAMMAENANLARYKPVLDRRRAMRPYQLSDELETFLHDLGAVGDAWEKLFDETIAGLEFEVDGETFNIEGTTNFMTDPDRAKREEAAHELASVFEANIKTFARVHNTLAKEKEIIDRWRHMPTAQTARHLSNDVEPEVVEEDVVVSPEFFDDI